MINTKPLFDKMQAFSARKGERIYEVYTSLIDYMTGYLDWTGHPVHGWKYQGDDNVDFYNMMITAFQCIAKGIENNGWCDIFGDIFMEYLGDKDKKGQCFTPDGICNLTAKGMLEDFNPEDAKTPCGSFGTKIAVCEPSCGSGRLALALGETLRKDFGEYAYLSCEDIDTICVKQTAINLAIHGFYGEVVCHDTLKEPDKVRFGFIVNEGLHPSREGLPTLRYSENPTHFLCTKYWKSRKRGKVDLFDGIDDY